MDIIYVNIDIIMFFLNMILICSTVSGLLTEAIKKFCDNTNGKIKYVPNAVALINAFVVGGGTTIVVYIYNGIYLDLKSITTLICMIGLTWIGSMVGFDKIKQTLSQISINKSK